METFLLIVLGIAIIVIIFLARKPATPTTKTQKLPGVRREAARERHVPKSSKHLFTRQVESGSRRFYFDVDEGERGKYLRISELEKDREGAEQAFTLIVFKREIMGFYRALTDAAREMDAKI